MTTVHILYYLAHADFQERTRRYSFLVMLGLVVWLAYISTTGVLVMSIPPNYVGESNSAWVGALITLTATLFLGWFGFYLVKGSIQHDYQTGVGQILATTQLSRPIYALGKWLSHAAVLAAMSLILLVAGVLMNVFAGSGPFDAWALVSPLLFVALPTLFLTAALAVLFETVGWLRSGAGNIVYFFLFIFLLVLSLESQAYLPELDFTGIRLIGDRIIAAANQAYPDSGSGFSFSIQTAISNPQYFRYEGVDWSLELLGARALALLLSAGLVLLASIFFDRFSQGDRPVKQKPSRDSIGGVDLSGDAGGTTSVGLTPLPAIRRFRFLGLYAAEMRLLWKGRSWWWYAVALGLVAAQVTVPPSIRPSFLAAAWLWLILVFSGLGNREAEHNTWEIAFSAPRPALCQAPAIWLAATSTAALMGSGALLCYLLEMESRLILSWLSGVAFVPSLALALGVLTHSRKPFEVIFITWMYILMQGVPALDFVGVTQAGPWEVYILLAAVLLALAVFIRGRQVIWWSG